MNRASALKTITEPKFKAVCEQVVSNMQRLRVPGVAIGIYHDGQEYSAGFGVTSVENPLPVTADTLFQTGSISKTFTGTIFMRLVEAGKVELDAPVRAYLPKLKMAGKGVAEQVTIRHLLTHTGGWVGDYFNDFGNGDDAQERMVRDIGKLEQVTPLGEYWSYNNAGFNIAGRVIEAVTGKSFEQVAKEMVLDPLGMKMSFYFPDDIMITHRFVVGHQLIDREVKVLRPWAIGRAGAPVGGVVSTVKDLLTYARFHMGDGKTASGEKILSSKSLKEMKKPYCPSGGFEQICLTWFLREKEGLKIYGHGGATHGQRARLSFIPEKQFAVAVLANSEDANTITMGALGWALKSYFDLDMFVPEPVETPAEQLAEYAGQYELPRTAFSIECKNGQLFVQEIPRGGFPTPDVPPGPPGPSMRAALYEKDKLIVLDEPMKNNLGEFLRNEDGSLAYLRLASRVHRKTK